MSTFTCLNYHVVFSTRYRKERIEKSFQDDLYSYIGGIIRGEKGHLIEIGLKPGSTRLSPFGTF